MINVEPTTEYLQQLEQATQSPDSGALLSGSSKEFYPTSDPTIFRVRFKDVMHGGGRMQEIEGTGRLREEFCYWFYRLLEREGIRTHIANQINGLILQNNDALRPEGILVRKMDMVAIELIARYVTRGNWVDAHKFPVFPSGIILEKPIIEMCLKWKKEVENLDFANLTPWQKKVYGLLKNTPLSSLLMQKTVVRDDPRLNGDVAIALHVHAKDSHIRGHMIESKEEEENLRLLILQVNSMLCEFLSSEDWILEDGKFEVGIPLNHGTREFFVGDEYTQDSSRIRDKEGNSLTKDLHRNMKSSSQIYDGYARLTEAIYTYVQ